MKARRTEPQWLDRQTVEAIHAMVVVQSGGSAGLRDAGLLESAIARAQQHRAYNDRADLFDLAAALGAGLARNHPFVDGNKRIAFVATVTFLELNGARFRATEAEAVLVMLDVATGKLKEPAFAAWLRANSTRRRRR